MSQRNFSLFSVILFGFVAINLSACATATRGSQTMFVVETAPIGAKATTTIATKDSPKITARLRKQIAEGETELPEISYRSCEPTPCGIKIPRRSNFHVLVTKDGYAPVVAEIGNMHRKEIKKETVKNTALAAGATGAAGAAAMSAAFASWGGVTTGGAIASGAILALPVVMVGGASLGVDSATGANYDVWPNPLPLALQETSAVNANSENELLDSFARMQRQKSLEPPLTSKEKKAKSEATRLRLQQALQAQNNQGS